VGNLAGENGGNIDDSYKVCLSVLAVRPKLRLRHNDGAVQQSFRSWNSLRQHQRSNKQKLILHSKDAE
jgi:hypothetical protein